MNIDNKDLINFRGYKNIIHNEIPSQIGTFSFISMQLNDDQKHKDLSKFQEFLSNYNVPKTDVLILKFIEGEKGKQLVLNEIPLPTGHQLNKINNKSNQKTILKAYSLLGKLSTRILENPLFKIDIDLCKVFKESLDNLNVVLKNQKDSLMFVNSATINKNTPEKLASKINYFISSTMDDFLKFR